MGLVNRAAAHLVDAGWMYRPQGPTGDDRPTALQSAPESVVRWVSSFSQLSSSDDTVWFVARDDYGAGAEAVFAWNECELLSVQSAITVDEASEVSRFWQRHIPVLLSVRNGYEYLAVRIDGAVVHGTEPEFEAADVVFPHFEDLLRYIVARPARRNPVVESLLFAATGVPDCDASASAVLDTTAPPHIPATN